VFLYRKNSHLRAAALIITVLVTLAAATIALLATRAALSASIQETTRARVEIARLNVWEANQQITVVLLDQHLVMYSEVLPQEPPRWCETLGVSVAPGEPWPLECGLNWNYEASDINDTLEEWGTASLVRPFNFSSTLPYAAHMVQVETISQVGSMRVGLRSYFRSGGVNSPLLYAGSDLDMNSLTLGAASVDFGSAAYSVGELTLPGASVSLISPALLAAESGFTVPPSDASLTYAGPSESLGSPATYAIRNVYPQVMSPGALESELNTLYDLTCAELCIRAGQDIVVADGSVFTVPETAAAYLLRPVDDELYLYIRTIMPDLLPGENCDGCNLNDTVTSDTNPGRMPFWTTTAGAFSSTPIILDVPPSGLLSTDRDTFVGLCNANSPGSTSPCQSSLTFTENFTLIAGASETPVDVYLSGPFAGSDAKALIYSSGDVVLPWWSTSASGGVTMDVSLVALGRSGTDTFRTLPTNAPASVRPSITLTGAIMFNNFSTGGATFTGVSLQVPPDLPVELPIWYPTAGSGLQPVFAQFMPISEITDLLFEPEPEEE